MKFKQTLAAILAICMVLTLAVPVSAAEVVETGSLGENVTYTLYDDQTLVIEGTGDCYIEPDQFSGIVAVEIREGITDLGYMSFYGTPSLRTATVSGTVKKLEKGTFGNCTSLESVVLNEGLETIGESCFMNCALNEITIPSTVTTIGAHAFSGCRQLQQVVIPENVTYIGEAAFGYTLLDEVVFTGGPVLFGSDVFITAYDANKIPTVYYPDNCGWTQDDMVYLGRAIPWVPYTLDAEGNRVPDESRTYISEYREMTSGRFPEGGEWRIDEEGVLHISGAETITPDSGSTQYWANITGLVIEPGVKTMYHQFNNYDSLTFAAYSDDLEYTPSFFACPALEEITFGKSATSLSRVANCCPKLRTLNFHADSMYISDATYLCNNLESVVFYGSAPDYISDEAFPSSHVIHFYYPANDPTWTEEIISTPYGSSAVWTPFTLDSEDNMIPDTAASTNVTGATREWDLDGFTATLTPDGLLTLEGTGALPENELCWDAWTTATRIEIGNGITFIPKRCFASLEYLEYVSFPDSLTGIGDEAFGGCKMLKEIQFGNGLETIGERAFFACTSLTALEIPGSVSVIGIFAFENCTNLSDLTLNDGLEYISDGAFYNSGVTDVTIPSTVLDMGYGDSTGEGDEDFRGHGAFENCMNMTSVTILSEHITRIPYACFAAGPSCVVAIPSDQWEWSGFKNIKLPSSVRIIEDYAFYFNSMSTFIISENVEEIGPNNFVGCDNLSTMIFTGETPVERFYCFVPGVTAYYPAEYKDNYPDSYFADKFIAWYPCTLDENGNYIIETEADEAEVADTLDYLMEKYPEGYALDEYSVSVLNGTGLVGYGSQAFAYILSDELFGALPTSVDTTVTFDEVMVGDILRLDNDTRAVVITEVKDDHVVVVQGDWQGTSAATYSLRTASSGGTVHWGETLSLEQVESADYRITRYEGNLLADTRAVTSEAPELPKLEVETPTEDEVYEFLLSLASSHPEGMPYTTEIKYTTTADMTGMQLSPIGQGCSAFAFQTSDRIFGDAPMREILDIDYDDVMVGDILHYDPDPNDDTTHVVVVLEIYKDHLVTVEANYNESIHWGSTFTREEVESMLGHYTRYSADTVAPERGDPPYVLGDVNEDGEIDILDANLVVAWYNEIRDLEDNQLLAADVNGDGEVDIMDANMIVAYYNEVIDAFPTN